jgi:hypothetical protein
VNGTTLVIKTASGQPVTVTTTGATKVSMSRAPLSDITDGALVMASGHSSDGTIAADHVTLGSQPQAGKVEVPPGIVQPTGPSWWTRRSSWLVTMRDACPRDAADPDDPEHDSKDA